VAFEGLPESLAEAMRRRYGPYLASLPSAGALRVAVAEAPLEYFIPPGFAPGWEVYRMATALESGVFRTVSYRLASWIDVRRRHGRIALARGERDHADRAMENFLRSAVAWLALESDGLFVHGASIIRGRRCFLFFGPSGAGKSTLSAMNTEGEVNSDDLTLLLRRDGALVACGAPFRGTYTRGEPLVGTWPVAGFYRLRKDMVTAVRSDDGGCFADLVGNLPFVVDQLPAHPELMDRVRKLAAGVPLRSLHFRKDVPIWPAIDAADGRIGDG
jgi:hypothetical protein